MQKGELTFQSTENEIELPENYKPQHKHRVYYPNSCNYCFSSYSLLKCSSCLTVSYCSKQHQIDDWLFHKPTCMALRKITIKLPYPEDCNYDKFMEYSNKLLCLMIHHRGFLTPEQLTEYERQICLLPWVCIVCFKKASSKYVCGFCLSVSYCSIEHMKMDHLHPSACTELRICRILSSVHYENGVKTNIKSITYCPIGRNVKKWPRNKLELCALVQRDLRNFCSDEAFVAINQFIAPFIPGATVINVLEAGGIIRKRHLMTKSSRTKWRFDQRQLLRRLMENPSETVKTKSTMMIHVPFADKNELDIQWDDVARILVDWIHNIDDVEVVLSGPKLKYCEIPKLDFDEKLVRVSVYLKQYEDIKFTKRPDVIVIFECQRTLASEKDFWDTKCVNGLFRYHNVPLILLSGDPNSLDGIQDTLNVFHFVEILEDISENHYTSQYIRVFKDCFHTYKPNYLFSILKRN